VTDDPESGEPPQIPIRIGDQDRERIAEQLSLAFSEGRLTLEEFGERTSAAYAAKTTSELVPLTRDLPVAPTAGAVSAVGAVGPVGAGPQPERSTSVAIMGGRQLRGRWRPAKRNRAIALMGGFTIDLREAELTGPVISLFIVTVMGGATIVVPEGVRVETSGFAFMGGRSEHIADVAPVPGLPVVRVTSYCLMGGVDIKSKAPGEP